MRYKLVLAAAALSLAGAISLAGQSNADAPKQGTPSAPDHAAIQQKLEAYLRNIYAWGPTVKLTFPEFVPASVDGMYKVTASVAFGDQSDKAVFLR